MTIPAWGGFHLTGDATNFLINGSVEHDEGPKMDAVMTDAFERLQEDAPAIVTRALQGLAMKLASAVVIMTLVLTPAHAVEPFGVATTPSQSAGLTTLWLGLQTELAKDEVEISHCRTDANCGSSAAQRFIAIVDEARRYSGRSMIGHLNRGINGAI